MLPAAPPARFYQAVIEFNERRFFECHETLEALWNEERSDLRRFYQGLLQIGVGYYKIITKPNYRGALALLESGSGYLAAFEPQIFGVDVSGLVQAARLDYQELRRLGPERLAEFDQNRLPTIVLKDTGVIYERG